MSQLFPNSEEVLFLEGPVGSLECIAAPARGAEIGVSAIICHPHPQMGGAMSNKVVHTVARALRELGCRTVRFNFRGVGASQGEYDNAVGEVDDLMAVANWVHTQFPGDELLLAGFSFGSFVAASGLSRCLLEGMEVRELILVAPPIHHMGFYDLPAFERPVLVIQGLDDEVVPADSVIEWAESIESSAQRDDGIMPVLVQMTEAGHFFHGKLTELKNVVMNNVSKMISI